MTGIKLLGTGFPNKIVQMAQNLLVQNFKKLLDAFPGVTLEQFTTREGNLKLPFRFNRFSFTGDEIFQGFL